MSLKSKKFDFLFKRISFLQFSWINLVLDIVRPFSIKIFVPYVAMNYFILFLLEYVLDSLEDATDLNDIRRKTEIIIYQWASSSQPKTAMTSREKNDRRRFVRCEFWAMVSSDKKWQLDWVWDISSFLNFSLKI